MLCFLSSSLQPCCPSSGHRDSEMLVLGFLWTLLCVRVFEDKRLRFDDSVQHSNLLFLLQQPFISLPVFSPVLSISFFCHSWVCISLFPCLTYFHLIPLFQLLWESQCCSACSSWISANVVLPARSCISPPSLSLSHPYLPPPLSLASTSHQVATHSSTGDYFQLWHHTTLHEPSILVQINLIGPWIRADREAEPEKKTTRHYHLVIRPFICSLR